MHRDETHRGGTVNTPGEDVKLSLGTLATLAPDTWFTRREQSSFWLRIYTTLLVPRQNLEKAIEEFVAGLNKEKAFLSISQRTAFAVGGIKELKIPVFTVDMFAEETGRTRLNVKVDQKSLTDSSHIFLATPFRVDGKAGIEAVAKAALATAAGLICVHAGLNGLRDLVFDGEVNAVDGTFSLASQPWRMPQPCEGPFWARQNGEDIQEIAQCVSRLGEPQRGRISLALQFVDAAMRNIQGFFEYWTGLEVLCEGRSHRIKARLARLYGIRDHKEAATRSGFKTLEKWRHDYIHRGKRPPLTADVERYLQLLFVDLLRQELRLPARGHLAAMQAAVGYDLSPIGLTDNRTEQQRQAIAELLK